MNFTFKRTIRFLVGTLLPVPLFVSCFYFSYFYLSYNGFDHETKTYITEQHSLEISRKHLRTDFLFFITLGYFLMGLPSLVYSLLLERHRSSSRYQFRSYVGWGTLMGGISGLAAAIFHFVLTDGFYDSLLVIAISSGVGGVIPLLMAISDPGRPFTKDREKNM